MTDYELLRYAAQLSAWADPHQIEAAIMEALETNNVTEDDMARTLKELAREVLLVQDACNLSGVAQGFARAMSDLCALGLDTDARNTHPIAILWADKIASLTGTQDVANDTVFRAYTDVYKLAE